MNASADVWVRKQAAELTSVTEDFTALYRQHFDFVWRSLRRLGVREASVEDAVQDTFVVLHRRLSDLRPQASAKSFLFAIAVRVARDYRRTAKRKPADPLDQEAAPSCARSPFEQAANAQAARQLEVFLDSLDEPKRAVFAAAELEGMTAPEVAEALAIPVNTVYSRLRVARQHFVLFLSTMGGRGHG